MAFLKPPKALFAAAGLLAALALPACSEPPSWQKLLTAKISEQYPGYKSLSTTYTGPRWGAIGMSVLSGHAVWADAHARAWAAQSPDFTPTRRASAFSGGLRRCAACQ